MEKVFRQHLQVKYICDFEWDQEQGKRPTRSWMWCLLSNCWQLN